MKRLDEIVNDLVEEIFIKLKEGEFGDFVKIEDTHEYLNEIIDALPEVVYYFQAIELFNSDFHYFNEISSYIIGMKNTWEDLLEVVQATVAEGIFQEAIRLITDAEEIHQWNRRDRELECLAKAVEAIELVNS